MQLEKLALFGGKPIVSDHSSLRIGWPMVSDSVRNKLIEVIEARDFSGRGSQSVFEFEKHFSQQYDRYATGLHSGTAALHAALYALNIKPGDEVIVPNFTFVATAMAVLHALAIPVFADIDPISYNISPSDIRRRITARTKAIIVVHMQGMPAAMDEIVALCKQFKLKLIEDVAQAPGATYRGQLTGTFGDAAAFSFMPQKNIGTCGECGLLLTKTAEQKNRAEMLRIYGEIIDPGKSRAYHSFTLGWNYTLGPLEAAMARIQAVEYPIIIKKIQESARKLSKGLSFFSWAIPPKEPADCEAVFHFYRVRLCSPNKKVDDGRFRRAIQEALDAEGLNARLYQNSPISEQLVFKKKQAFGSGLPWVLNKGVSYDYPIDEYTNTLNMLRSTLVLGAIGSAPAYLLCNGTAENYIEGFKKINDNMDDLLKFASRIDYKDPWEEVPVISDSFGTEYRIG